MQRLKAPPLGFLQRPGRLRSVPESYACVQVGAPKHTVIPLAQGLASEEPPTRLDDDHWNVARLGPLNSQFCGPFVVAANDMSEADPSVEFIKLIDDKLPIARYSPVILQEALDTRV